MKTIQPDGDYIIDFSEKPVLVIEKNYGKFEAEGQEFANILRSLEQFIQTVKGQNKFGNRMLFYLVPGGLDKALGLFF